MNRITFSLSVLIASACLTTSAIGNEDLPLHIPDKSDLHLINFDKQMYQASFSGQLLVSGRFRVEWNVDMNSAQKTEKLNAEIIVDSSDLQLIPRFGDDMNKEIWIEDATAAMQVALQKPLASQVMNHQVHAAEIHGYFLLTNLTIGECGSPWASAKLMSAKDLGKGIVSQGNKIGDC